MQARLKATTAKRKYGFVACLVSTDTTEALTGKPYLFTSRFYSDCTFVHRADAQSRADSAMREAMEYGYIPCF